MQIKYCIFCVQAGFSMFILFHAVPQSNGDSVYRALSLAVLGYCFPSPISLVEKEGKQR
ncbi:hypothetical protein MiSe_89960 [Microseira wollei NIES-4236]|uniref:Uncharacterized protein n=1 Tax=Microseira wollei NIES-4236 TaxID=2530354 RepID=A0AAV3XTP2_9CYAN|nr:hypothetical protein MiSe_89960 [Microseira wollei NIES-4236]